MGEGTVRAVFTTVPFTISLMNTGPGLIVPQVIATFCVSRRPMQKRTSEMKQNKDKRQHHLRQRALFAPEYKFLQVLTRLRPGTSLFPRRI